MTSKLTTAVASVQRHPIEYFPDEIYVVMDKNQYYRAKILKEEKAVDQCKCFLIDVGTMNWYCDTNIFQCPFDLQRIPPMAIHLNLIGLTEFNDNRNARQIVVANLAEKVVWAKIHTKKEDFKRNKSIDVFLYDTIDPESRTNLGSQIMEKLVETFSPPRLSKSLTNYVVISHVSKSTGIIYCHMLYDTNDIKYVNDMIQVYAKHELWQSFKNAESETEIHHSIANNAGKLYLVWSHRDENWYRATIVQLETDAASASIKHDKLFRHCYAYCFLIDHGNTRYIPLDAVYELDGILSKYPFLVVALQLDGVHMIPAKIRRLKELLPQGEKVMVDVVQRYINEDANKPVTISVVKMARVPKYAGDSKCNVNDLLQ